MKSARTRLIAGLVFAGALAAPAIIGAVHSHERTAGVKNGPPTVFTGPVIPSENGPFIDGKQVTLEEAEAAAGFKVHRPDHSLASDKTITAVWIGTVPTIEIAIEYESGVEVRLDEWDLADTPDQVFQRLADQFAADSGSESSTYLGTVEGGPALLIPMAYKDQNNKGSVQFVVSDNVRVWVYGNYDAATLTEIANTVT